MPELTPLVRFRFEQAVSHLENSILKELAARPLSTVEIDKVYGARNFARGWQIDVQVDGRSVDLNILVTANFPFDEPRIGVADVPPPLTYPHVEGDGLLCLLTNAALISPLQPVGVLHELLKDANDLLVKNFRKENLNDFRNEFLSYWNRALSFERLKFTSVVTPNEKTRIAAVWCANDRYIFGDNEETLYRWLKNRYGQRKRTLRPAVYLWTPLPLIPDEYPKTAADVLKISAATAKGIGKEILVELASKSPDEIPVLLGSKSEFGPCLAGIVIHKPRIPNSDYLKARSPLHAGFRKGHIPRSILVDRFLNSPTLVGRHQVERADPSWIHGRDQFQQSDTLSKKSVAVLGCGSIGGSVAKLLASMGVGKIILVDPENLTWANTGRHYLGAKCVDLAKAKFLADELSENYPHLEIIPRSITWQGVARDEPELLRSTDVIISLMGDWSPESLLNEWQIENDVPPIIYGWTEAQACAGHSVAIIKGKGCLKCQFSELGKPNLQVTEWDVDGTLKQEPACGVMYQPYGPVELGYTINLVAEMAMEALLEKVTSSTEHLWATRTSILMANGGKWTAEWLALTNNADGGFIHCREWTKDAHCPMCCQP